MLYTKQTGTNATAKQTYIWSDGQIVYEQTGTDNIGATVYTYGLTRLSAKERTVSSASSPQVVLHFYRYNAHGDVVRLVSTSGVSVKIYEYDAFGNERNATPGDTNPFRYCGEYYDTTTQKYFLRARWYDPATGRFTQQDSWNYYDPNDPLSLNLYSYCAGNPVKFIDPSGRSATISSWWSVTMWWIAAADGPIPAGDIIYVIGIVVTGVIDLVNTIGVHNVAQITQETANTIDRLNNNSSVIFDEAAKASGEAGGSSSSGGAAPSPGDPNWGKGFDSFKQVKKYLGSAGEGKQWHHIVEQCQIDKSGFSAQTIHNTNNLIPVQNDVHAKISGYYSSIDKYVSSTMRVRDYLAGKSFEYQYEFGLKVLREFGVIQ